MTATLAEASAPTEGRAPRAPLTRLLRSELRWVLRRPRTLIGLGLLGLAPVVIGIGISLATGSGRNGPDALFGLLKGNGLLLPLLTLFLSMPLLLPLVGAMSAADALAGESANGTLRGLLLAPVSRVRLLGVKAFGVATVTLIAVAIIAVVGAIAGPLLLGGTSMLTLSGTTLTVLPSLGRVLLAVLWVTVQIWAVGAIALAISACTEHPLIAMASTLAGLIVCTVLESISSLGWLQPYLLPDSWGSIVDLVRDPLDMSSLTTGTWRAVCYIVVGLSLATARMATKDA
ncbi:ABC transporter permease subunit [Solihabitans fulvus]|uniref:ABC transporter permease subunit n=1 Tax=Solihabitans fulvus TaxID=1892852 RepID=A0A5B2XM64_9PSEU|nr:ABC transporter permease subunit [Solihabitans fulvus]KAA2264009.1 ABC transporter permease subunit [Solihabitans fulvus]